MSDIHTWISFLPVFILLFIVPYLGRKRRRRIAQLQRRRAKKKGVTRKMPVDMLSEYIGQVVSVCVAGELAASQYTLLQVEENWIKVENKNSIMIINGDMISSISVKKTR